MKLLMAIVVYLLMMLVFGTAIVLLVAGKPWLFLAAVPVYLIAFAKIGCLSH